MPNPNQIVRIIELGVQQTSHINERDLQLAVAALAQENARARATAGSVVDLTDSSTGSADADGTLVAIVTPTVAAQDGVLLQIPKTAFDTQIGLIEDAHEELLVKVNEYIDLIAIGSATVAAIAAAAAADDTIAAITPLFTGTLTADEGVEAVGALAQINNARNIQASIAAGLNWVRVALGMSTILDGSGGLFERTQAEYPTADAAATGTAAAAGEDSIEEITGEAAMTALVDNIATLSAELDLSNDPSIGPFVVATNSPRFRFVDADVAV